MKVKTRALHVPTRDLGPSIVAPPAYPRLCIKLCQFKHPDVIGVNLFITETSIAEEKGIAATANSASPAEHAAAIGSHSQAVFL